MTAHQAPRAVSFSMSSVYRKSTSRETTSDTYRILLQGETTLRYLSVKSTALD
jgi:hypothetical protein